MTAVDPSLREVFLGRQPVLDRQQGLAGYELLISTAGSDAGSQFAQTADLVCNAFGELGLARALAGCRAFLPVDADFLEADTLELLPRDSVVLQLDCALVADATVLERCRKLRSDGYEFCLTGMTGVDESKLAPLEIASFLKVELSSIEPARLNALALELKTTRKPLIIGGIATREQMELCTLIGADFFQGYYFAQPDFVAGRTLNPSIQTIFRLIGQLAADAEIEDLESILRGEPALVVSLLRLTNSVGDGARMRITSIRHAISVLGRRQLRRWLQLLLFRQGGEDGMGRNPLMQYAALRGRFMELLAAHLHAGNKTLHDPAFITGLMSVLPAALGMSMREILEQMAVDDVVRLALLYQDGQLGKLLAIVDAYDANDPDKVMELLSGHAAVALGDLGELLARSLEWVQSLDESN